jgi:hypothetical protein
MEPYRLYRLRLETNFDRGQSELTNLSNTIYFDQAKGRNSVGERFGFTELQLEKIGQNVEETAFQEATTPIFNNSG